MNAPPLTLRPIRTRDADDYHEIFGNPEVCRYDDFSPITQEESIQDIVRIIDAYARNDKNTERAIIQTGEDKMIGVFTVLCGRKYRYIGYHFKQTCWGRGYATAIVRLYLASLKPKTRSLIRARVDSRNAPSIRVLEKCGFQRGRSRLLENRTREYVYHFLAMPSR
ncbi:MAG: GNAT family N-acetyltransferase [Kiritimatiellae bacterium]|nr:GNAT family N-acetyltransferase [Kiritimatiellia bacterium]